MLTGLIGLARGALVGLLLGVAARVLMRVVAMGMGAEPQLDLTVSGVLVGLFALSGGGAGLAAGLGLEGWVRWLVLAFTSGFLVLMGLVFAVGEVVELLGADLSAAMTVGLLLVAAGILLLVMATPLAGWQGGGSRRALADDLAEV